MQIEIEIEKESGEKMNRYIQKKDTDRDNFMSADEACAYGLIDEVIAKHK